VRIIRPATPMDVDAINTLYQDLVTGSHINVLPERIAAIAADANNHLWVCSDKDEVIATALLSLRMDAMLQHQPFAIIENL